MQNQGQDILPFLDRLLHGEKVEWKPLGEVCEIKRGRRLVRKELKEVGDYAVYQNSTTPLGYYHESNVQGDTTFIISAGAAGEIVYKNSPFWAADDVYYFVPPSNLLSKFLFYYLLTQQAGIKGKVRRASVPRLSKSSFDKMQIPIPPLRVQKAIVSILDKFTQLEAELEAELDCRKRQYEYYRNQLLSFNSLTNGGGILDSVTIKKLGEVARSITSGGTPLTSHQEYYGGNIPWLRTQEVNNADIWDTEIKITEEGLHNSSAKLIPPNCVIMAMYGATVGRVAINKIPLTTNQACANIEVNENIANYRYIYYYLFNQYKYIKSLGVGSQTNINAQIVRNLSIPLPPLSEQQRIVAILDKFDALTNSISEGLPKEIALRRKQYEYYRERLLSFEHN